MDNSSYKFDLSSLANREALIGTYMIERNLKTTIKYEDYETEREFTFIVREYDCRPQAPTHDLLTIDANFVAASKEKVYTDLTSLGISDEMCELGSGVVFELSGPGTEGSPSNVDSISWANSSGNTLMLSIPFGDIYAVEDFDGRYQGSHS